MLPGSVEPTDADMDLSTRSWASSKHLGGAHLDLFRVDVVATVENVVHQAPDLQFRQHFSLEGQPKLPKAVAWQQ